MTDCGREHTGRVAVDWVETVVALGAGAIMLTSIDRDGTKAGFDLELPVEVLDRVDVPMVAHGGAWTVAHLIEAAGAGGMCREALAWLRDARPDVDPVALFVADATEHPHGFDVALPVVDSVVGLAEININAAVVAIGNGRRRRMVANELSRAGIKILSVLNPTAFRGPGVVIGFGSILAHGVVLSRDVTVGSGVIVNFGAAVGHDCTIADFASLGPGAVLTGNVRIGAVTLVGAGAIILPRRVVGDGATVGAGAVVTQDVAEGIVVAGNPAHPIDGPSGHG